MLLKEEKRLFIVESLSSLERSEKGLAFQKSRINKLKKDLKGAKTPAAAQNIRIKISKATDLAQKHQRIIKNLKTGKSRMTESKGGGTSSSVRKQKKDVFSKIKRVRMDSLKSFKFGKSVARIPQAGVKAVNSLSKLPAQALSSSKKAYSKFTEFLKRNPSRRQAEREMEDTIEEERKTHKLTPENVAGLLFIFGVALLSL